MSQFWQGVTAGALPPSVAQQFTADDATVAVPVAGNLNLFTNDTTANNNNGIQSTATVGTVTTLLTNRLQGTGTTTANSTVDLVTFSLGATPGAYYIEAHVIGFNSSTPAATSFTVIGAVRTTGVAGFVVVAPDETVVEDISMLTCDIDFIASGNNFIIRATGVNTPAFVVNWNVVANYVFVS